MKARIIPAPPPLALVWALEKAEGGAALAGVCEAAGVGLRAVKPEELGCTVGALCGLPGAAQGREAGASAPQVPALVLWGLERPAMESLLDAMAAAGVKIPLKAVVTDTSRGWTFAALLAELAAERRALGENRA